MELRQLRYFVAVAEALHFGRAAEKLHISQQSLSAQIKQLENELGTSLFERTTRRVHLTLAGQVLLKEVRVAFNHLAIGVENAQRAGRGEIGRLIVGYHSTTLYNIMPSTVHRFREEYPDMEVVLKEMPPHSIEEGILSGQIDVGFSGFLMTPFSEVAYEIVYRDPLAVALPKGHPLEKCANVPLAALANEPFVMYSQAHKPAAFDQLLELCQNAGFSPRIVQEAESETAVLSLVATGVGVAIATMSLQSIRSDQVVYRPLVDPSIDIKFVIIWKHDNLSPLVKSFVQTAQEFMETESAHGVHESRGDRGDNSSTY